MMVKEIDGMDMMFNIITPFHKTFMSVVPVVVLSTSQYPSSAMTLYILALHHFVLKKLALSIGVHFFALCAPSTLCTVQPANTVDV